ncbi:CoA transferase [Phaeacidiphilus oryzae]|uniref:CoA transferase n=1 Tax=Phaeacidiphilus oryzae TaxID=348818 RepID=UPI00056421A0|nr:CoA transferase [Phaeacidiphilus oryzae]
MNDDRAELAGVWRRLGGDAALVERVTVGGPVPLDSPPLPLGFVAGVAAAAAALAGAEYLFPFGVPELVLDPAAVATAFGSERHLRLEGERVVGFAPLSKFWPAADGWVRTHANYPHHQQRLLKALGTDAEGLGSAIAGRPAAEVEEMVCDGGGLAFAVRTEAEWAAHPQGRAVAAEPLVSLEAVPGAAPERPVEAGRSFRVLDLTRTIAGPVAGRTLSFLGADVLRVDSPQLAEIPEQHLDTGWGKRSTLLDLAARSDREVFEELLIGADVVLIGYRPGALDRFGLSPEELAARHPGVVVGTLAAWGRTGPWAGRRGFDSLVQAATGIALLTGAGEEGRPGALPVQALDHASGYLLAAAVLRGLVRRRAEGGSQHASVTLAGTANWLLGAERSAAPAGPLDPAPYLAEADTAAGRLRYALPPFRLPGGPLTWAEPVHPWGSDRPSWR